MTYDYYNNQWNTQVKRMLNNYYGNGSGTGYNSGYNNYTDLGNGYYLSKRSGLHTSQYEGPYSQYSSALGKNFYVNEYVPYYHNSYNTSTAAGRAQMAADRAEAANISRYYEILEGYKSLLDNGQSAINSAYDKSAAQSLQNLTSRGMSNATILNNALSQNNVNRAKALQSNYATNLGNMLSFMERRNDGTGKLTE